MTFPTVAVTVRLYGQGGVAMPGVKVTARLDKSDAHAGFVVSVPVSAVTDTNGAAVLNVFPNAPAPSGLGTTGSVYEFSANPPGSRRWSVQAQIPNQACDLEDVIEAVQPEPTLQHLLAAATGTTLVGGTWFGGVIATVAALATSAGASLIGFINSGAGAVARSLQDKWREAAKSVIDYNAAADGVTNDVTPFSNANAAALAAGGGFILVPGGKVYQLSSAITSSGLNTWLFGPNVNMLGSTIDAVTDNSALQSKSGFGFAKRLAATTNENGAFLSGRAKATGSAAGYQKNLTYTKVIHEDPSIYSDPTHCTRARDLVAHEVKAFVAAGVVDTRLWAYHVVCSIPSGADGLVKGFDIEMVNDGSDALTIGNKNSKYGYKLLARGAKISTAGFILLNDDSAGVSDPSSFQYGFVTEQDAVAGYAFALVDASKTYIAGIDKAGVVQATALKVKEGANAKQGVTAAMSGGSVTVANTSVTASSRIHLTRSAAGGTLGHLSYTKTAGVGFTVTSTSATETSAFDYFITEPA